MASEDELRGVWGDLERRIAFIRRLAEMGYDEDRLQDMQRLIDAPDSDSYDVLACVRFTLAPLSRAERAGVVKTPHLSGYEREMRSFLEYVLDSYRRQGIDELSPDKLADFLRIRYGDAHDAKRALGPIPQIRNAFVEVQGHLFR